jgi:hypothetical protein
MTTTGVAPRAPRFEISTPILFRQAGDEAWREGQTRNISRTGVLLEAGEPGLQAGTPVEFAFSLSPAPHATGAHVVCRGHVSRLAGSVGGTQCLAATIDDYQFQRP